MAEWRVIWQECPHVHHPSRVLYVEAATKEDADKIARDHVERKFGISWFSIHSISQAEPVPAGKVLEAR